MTRAAGRLAVLLAIASALVVAASAGAEGRDSSGGGIVKRGLSEMATPAALRAATKNNSGSKAVNLTWHGGPVMHSNTTYVVYWAPANLPMPAGYEATVNQFFTDVAHDSGTGGNVYSVSEQYTDSTSRAAYQSSFGGSWEDKTPIPDDCSAQYSGAYRFKGCALDVDLRDSIKRAIAANGWPAGPSSSFFVLTPPAVGSCSDNATRNCAYRTFCAYHSFFSQAGTGANVLYANIAYPDTTSVGAPGTCDTYQQPNGNWGDEAINLISHEHNEMITDPLLNAWYDKSGLENGDKCAWTFGTALGGSDGALWNQAINGDHYFVQREWSNATLGCALRSDDSATVPVVDSAAPTSAAPGAVVTLTGQHLAGATAVKFNSSASTFTVVNDTTITATVPAAATSGPITVVTPDGTAKTPADFTVAPVPIDFSIAVNGPASMTNGDTANYTVTLTRPPGFTGTVVLSVVVSPDATVVPTASFNPKTIPADGTTSTMTVKTKRTTTPGTYTLTVTGTKGDVTRSGSVTVGVAAASTGTK